jgi:selenocysteine lyase/cysteine desulfurase
MWATELPPGDSDSLRQVLFERHAVEVPVFEWQGRRLLRVSIAPYNRDADLDRLLEALRVELGPAAR